MKKGAKFKITFTKNMTIQNFLAKKENFLIKILRTDCPQKKSWLIFVFVICNQVAPRWAGETRSSVMIQKMPFQMKTESPRVKIVNKSNPEGPTIPTLNI